MLKRLFNECNFTLTLESKSPLLIKEGRYNQEEWFGTSTDKKNPDTFFICRNTYEEIKTAIENNNYSGIIFYIPGSSLRGVIRSHAERIIRTLTPDDPICCNPFSNSTCKGSYKDSCIICKLFGSTGTASRIYVHDSEIVTKGNKEERWGNAIDRFTGGVSKANGHGALFKNFIIENYTFKSQITIRNFEIWQLGLIAYILKDFNVFSNKDEPGLIAIGFGKNRGFGRIKGNVAEVWITYYDKDIDKKSYELMGVAELYAPSSDTYGFIKNDHLPKGLLDEARIDDDTLYKKRCKVKDNFRFFKECAGVWNRTVSELKEG